MAGEVFRFATTTTTVDDAYIAPQDQKGGSLVPNFPPDCFSIHI